MAENYWICASTNLFRYFFRREFAFGVDKNKIDQNAIEDAAKIANACFNLSQKYFL